MTKSEFASKMQEYQQEIATEMYGNRKMQEGEIKGRIEGKIEGRGEERIELLNELVASGCISRAKADEISARRASMQ